MPCALPQTYAERRRVEYIHEYVTTSCVTLQWNEGSLMLLPVPKQNRVTEIAMENNLPIVALVQLVWNDRFVA